MFCPKCSSNSYPHRLKKGQDGTMWRSTKLSSGKFRWQRTKASLTKRRAENLTKAFPQKQQAPAPEPEPEPVSSEAVAGQCECPDFETWTLPVNVSVYTADHECVGIIKYSNEEHDLKYSAGSPAIVIQKQMKASPQINSDKDLSEQFESFMELHDYEYEAVTMRNTLGNFLKQCNPAGKCISRWTPCSLANAVDQDGAPFPPDTVLILTAFELESKKGHLTAQHKKMGFEEVARV